VNLRQGKAQLAEKKIRTGAEKSREELGTSPSLLRSFVLRNAIYKGYKFSVSSGGGLKAGVP